MPDFDIEVLDTPRISTSISRQDITREDAYRVYITSGQRSLRMTADLLGLPHGTVLSWSSRYQWKQRAIDTDLEVTEGVADAAAAAVVAQQLKNIQYLASVRDSDEVDIKDRTAATKVLMSEFKDISKAIASNVDDVESMEEEELRELAQTSEGVAQLLARSRARIGAV